jgi:hypothetical protein
MILLLLLLLCEKTLCLFGDVGYFGHGHVTSSLLLNFFNKTLHYSIMKQLFIIYNKFNDVVSM